MAEEINTILWPWNMLEFVRTYVNEFDAGEVKLPYEGRFAPVPRATLRLAPAAGALFCGGFGALLVYNAATDPPELWPLVVKLGLGVPLIVGSALFLLPVLVGRRKQMTIRIDRLWVEVDDRPPLWRRRHWREPVANYTGVRRFHFELESSGGFATWIPKFTYAVTGIDLDHPDPKRIVPLLRTEDADDAERRWPLLARALDKPMTE